MDELLRLLEIQPSWPLRYATSGSPRCARCGPCRRLHLGERRARSVQEYLTSRGVPAGRLQIRSYGEERPKFDNAREGTRRLNHRAALVVSVQ